MAYPHEIVIASGEYLLHVNCVLCQERHTLIVKSTKGYEAWQNGQKHIQDALPELTTDQREMLLSGICPTCWDKTFGEED